MGWTIFGSFVSVKQITLHVTIRHRKGKHDNQTRERMREKKSAHISNPVQGQVTRMSGKTGREEVGAWGSHRSITALVGFPASVPLTCTFSFLRTLVILVSFSIRLYRKGFLPSRWAAESRSILFFPPRCPMATLDTIVLCTIPIS